VKSNFLNKITLSLILTLTVSVVCSQDTYQYLSDSARIKAIYQARTYARDSLGLDTGNDFYAWEIDSLTGHIKAKTVRGMYCYVYAYDPRTRRSPLKGAFQYFGNDEQSARAFADSLKQKGHETMLYKTAGTSAAKLTSRMLEYDPLSIRFIILHESVHRHRNNSGSGLPYVFEEALCDLVANTCAPALAKEDQKTVKAYTDRNEWLYTCINLARDGKISIRRCNREIKKALLSGDRFQNDRFGYKVNHAYLERYVSYCKYYFLLKEVLANTGDLQLFLMKVFALKGKEKEVAAKLEKMAGD
jgi:hypothetical protein